jgi:hypothetical protein
MSDVNNSKKTKLLLGFQKPRQKSAKTRKLGFLRNDCVYIGRGRKQKTNEKQEKNLR